MDTINDLRVYKTKSALVNAIHELITKKKFEDITVQNLCDIAMIRRATFYLNFTDKLDLFSFYIKIQFSNFPSYLKLKETNCNFNILQDLVADAIHYLNAHSDMVNMLIKSDSMPLIMSIITSVLTKDISEIFNHSLKNQDDPIKNEITARFYINGFFNTYIWWIKEKPNISEEDFIAYINGFISMQV